MSWCSRYWAIIAVVLSAALAAASAAQAFTFESQNSNTDGSPSYLDPDQLGQPTQRFDGNSGRTILQQGNTSFSFGTYGSSSRDPDHLDHIFDPVGHPAGEH